MAGIHMPCKFPNFSTNDAEKFERWLLKWCKEENILGKSMLVFDIGELSLRNRATAMECDNREVFQVTLKEITFAYIVINGKMCIMYKVWENKTQSVLHNMPIKWDGDEIWFPG